MEKRVINHARFAHHSGMMSVVSLSHILITKCGAYYLIMMQPIPFQWSLNRELKPTFTP